MQVAWDATVGADRMATMGERLVELGVPGEVVNVVARMSVHIVQERILPDGGDLPDGVIMGLGLGLQLGYHLWAPDGAGTLAAMVEEQ